MIGVLILFNPIEVEYIRSIGGIYIDGTIGTNTYTATVTGFTGYKIGQPIFVRFTNGNTGAAALDINGFGLLGIFRNANILLSNGDITDNSIHQLVFDGSGLQIISQGAKLTAAQMQTPLTGFVVGTNTALTAADTLSVAIGKLQGQINARITTLIKSRQSGTINANLSGSNFYTVNISPVVANNSVLSTEVAIITTTGAAYTAIVWSLASTYITFALPSNYSGTPQMIEGSWRLLELY